MPFAAVRNRRSLVALDNLADLIVTCLATRTRQGRTFLVSDDEDLSTPELLRRTATALGKRARLIPVPAAILRGWPACSAAPRWRSSCADRSQVDSRATRERLGWAPTVPIDVEIQRAAEHFISHRRQTS